MNEQANKILIDLLQKAANGVDAAVSFSQAQVPDIIRQLMVWKAAAYGMRIFFMSLFLLGCILLFRRALKWHESFDYEALGFFSLLSSALTGGASCCRDSGEHIQPRAALAGAKNLAYRIHG